jgi:phage/plasmid-like protein (TIGR03299 family)
MAHNVETMAFAGETPWHRNGVYCGQHNMTVEQAIEAASLTWKLKLHPAYTITGPKAEGGKLVRVPGRCYVARDFDNSVYGEVSDRYKIHQNHECFGFLNDLIKDGSIRIHTCGSLNGGRNVWILAQVGTQEIVPGDKVGQYLLLHTSHDGSGATRILFTEIRVVCANTARAALSKGRNEGVSIRHSTTLNAQVAKAEKALELSNKAFDKAVEFERALAQASMNYQMWEQFKTAIYPNPQGTRDNGKPVSKARAESKRKLLDEMLSKGRGMDVHVRKGTQVRNTLWGARNALTEALNYHCQVKGVNTATEAAGRRFESVMTGNAANLIQRADELLVEMLQA